MFANLIARKGFVYDPDFEGSEGMYLCVECGKKFYGGGNALHTEECAGKDNGYKGCVFVFGPKTVEAVQKFAKNLGDNTPYGNEKRPFSLKTLREDFPELNL